MRFAVFVALLLCSLTPAFADGRADWSGYDWRVQPFGQCLEITEGACLTHRAKWDWKRNQWVDLRYTPTADGLDLSITLTNNDRGDDDYVCVTALFLDASGANIAAYHANLHIDPSTTLEHAARLIVSPSLMSTIAKVDVGTKQCREGAGQDDAVDAIVRSRLPG